MMLPNELEQLLLLLTKYQVDDFTDGTLHIKMRLTQTLAPNKKPASPNMYPPWDAKGYPFPEQQYHTANKSADITQEELHVLGMAGVIPTIKPEKKARVSRVKDQ